MVLNINNFFDNRNRKSKIADFQDLDHIDGVSVSTVSANLYSQKRDDLVLFYFRDGVSHATVFTNKALSVLGFIFLFHLMFSETKFDFVKTDAWLALSLK